MKACRAFGRAALLAAVLLGAAACSSSASGPQSSNAAIRGIDVSGDFGAEPTVRIAAPLKLSTTQSQLAITGTGPQIQVDQLFVLQLSLYNARTGSLAASTLMPGQSPIVAKSSDDTLFPALVSALAGKPQGSRIVMALSPVDAFGTGGVPPPGLQSDDPVVVVADVLAVPPTTVLPQATGDPVAVPADSPAVELVVGDPSRIAVPEGLRSPSEVTIVALVQGTGAPVRAGSLVAVDFLGQEWDEEQPFVATYFKEPVVQPISAQGSVPSWDQALIGLPAGSRVLVIDPDPPDRVPGVAEPHERDTICWVIDVLGVS